MSTFRKIQFTTVFISLLFFNTVFAQHNRGNDIVDIAASNDQFSTLVAAVKAAGLVDALKSRGPLTVFAPTNEAFDKLPKGTVQNLLKPESRDQLIAILKYHVVSGRVGATDVANLRTAKTLNGQQVTVNVSGGSIKLDESKVITADINASNGIIHVIDRVLLPETKTIPEVAQSAGTFNTLLTAVTTAELANVLLSGEGPFTVFAPTDKAFSKLPRGTVESLLKRENRDQLVNILKYHVVSGRAFATDALKSGKIRTLEGSKVVAAFKDGQVKINQSNVVSADIDAANGVIHVIDRVLLPNEGNTAGLPGIDLIELAIAKGVPLFNHGNAGACADIYEVAALALLELDSNLPQDTRQSLAAAIEKAESTNNDSRRAWILRYALDDAYEALNRMMASM